MTVIIQLVVGVEYTLGGLDVLTVEWSWDHVPELGMLQQLQQLRSFFIPLPTFSKVQQLSLLLKIGRQPESLD